MLFKKLYSTQDFELNITVMYITNKNRLQNNNKMNLKIAALKLTYLTVFANHTRILFVYIILRRIFLFYMLSSSFLLSSWPPHNQSTPFKLWTSLKISENLLGTYIYMPAKFHINRSSNKIDMTGSPFSRISILKDLHSQGSF